MSTANAFPRPEPPPVPSVATIQRERDSRMLRPDVQDLKFRLHRKLLDKINVEALAATDERRVRLEVQQALLALIDGEPTLLNSLEREHLSDHWSLGR